MPRGDLQRSVALHLLHTALIEPRAAGPLGVVTIWNDADQAHLVETMHVT